MTDQPEALRLADALDDYWDKSRVQAAAELRRLHEAHEWQYKMAGDRLRRIEKLEKVNQELLAALNNIEVSTHDAMTAALARAAIAKAEVK